MSDFSSTWNISRSRLIETISDLNQEQLNWKLHPDALSIGQMAIHVAGVETLFASQLSDASLDTEGARLKASGTDGVVNEKPFPYSDSEISPQLVQEKLNYSKSLLEPLITQPNDEMRKKEIVSALGPIITGEGAFSRLAFHSAYHQGQAYLIRTAPGFPS